MKTNFALLLAVLLISGCSSPQKQSAPAQNAAPGGVEAPSPFDQTESGSKDSQGKHKNNLTCEKGSDTRKAEVLTEGKGCKVEYEKFGAKSVLASSAHGKGHCRTILAHLEKNLTTAGFVCK